MPSLNFKAQFAEAVESGRKTQSIRAANRFLPGDTAHLFTGMRTKKCRRLGKGIVRRTASFHIALSEDGTEAWVYVAAIRLKKEAGDEFARADGFNSLAELIEWFRGQHGLPFKGYVIYWELLKN